MQSKTIDLKLNYGIKNPKIISTTNNETIISSHEYIDNELKLVIYNYDEKISKLEKPLISSIIPKHPIISYDIIANDDEISIYMISNESLVKYSFSKNDMKMQISPSGDTVNQRSFNIKGTCKTPNPNPISLKISRNGSIVCISFRNGDLYVHDAKKLFDSDKMSFVIISIENMAPVSIKDISPDANTVITESENPKRCVLWDIEKKRRIVDLFHSSDSCMVDCVFSRIEAVSHIYNICAVYNANVGTGYWIVLWNCSTHAIKHSTCIQSRLSDSLCASSEGRYVAVSCFAAHSVDVFTSFNLQKLYTFSRIDADCGSWYSHFLPLSFSIDKLQHEFDLLCLYASREASSFAWLYESMRYNYSVVWPISAASVLIIAIFYFVLQFGL